MTALRLAGSFAVLLALVATAAASQTNWDPVKALSTGTRVRVTAGGRTVKGNVDHVTDDAVAVTTGKGQQTLDRQQVSVVSVAKPSHRKRNALIGLGAGTGAGLGIGLASRSGPNQLHLVPNSAVIVGSTVAGALVGTLVGVVIPTGGWHEIYRK